MPGAITHFLQAQKTLKSYNDKLTVNTDAFYWGAQGPDFFYCHRVMPWMKGENIRFLGEKLHNSNINNIIDAMVRFSGNDNIIKSYIYGYICHYSLDFTAHPYIEYLSQKLLQNNSSETINSLHTEIESSLDTIVLRKEKNELTTERNLKTYFPKNRMVQEEISRMYSFIIKELLKINIANDKILQATDDAQTVFSWITDKTSFKKNFMSKLESGKPHTISSHIRPFLENMEVDYANISNDTWYDDNGKRADSFFDLYEMSIKKAVNMIDDVKNKE